MAEIIARFSYPESGYPSDVEAAKKAGFVKGNHYYVERISMGQSSTSVYLKGCSLPFNSVQFDFFEDGEPLDIYRDARFNPYIRRSDHGK